MKILPGYFMPEEEWNDHGILVLVPCPHCEEWSAFNTNRAGRELHVGDTFLYRPGCCAQAEQVRVSICPESFREDWSIGFFRYVTDAYRESPQALRHMVAQ